MYLFAQSDLVRGPLNFSREIPGHDTNDIVTKSCFEGDGLQAVREVA